MSKPFKNAGITKELLFARMLECPDPKIRALIPKLRAVKGWSVDMLFEELCAMQKVSPDDVLK